MRIISRKRLTEFWKRHPDAEASLRNWFKVAIAADWANLQDVRQQFAHADGIELDCGLVVTVFNIAGNKYRLVTRMIYPYRRVYTKLVLNHKEYDHKAWKVKLCREHVDR